MEFCLRSAHNIHGAHKEKVILCSISGQSVCVFLVEKKSVISVGVSVSISAFSINAVRNTKSLICIYTAWKSVYLSPPSSEWLTSHQGGRKVRPECDHFCSTYKVLHDLSSNQDTQSLHSLCMLNCKFTCTVFSHNGLLPTVHLDPPETCPPCSSTI